MIASDLVPCMLNLTNHQPLPYSRTMAMQYFFGCEHCRHIPKSVPLYLFFLSACIYYECLLACRLSSHVIVVPRCQWVVVLGVCGFLWCRAPMAIRSWWCGHVIVSWSGGEASSSSSMGWPLTIPQRPCQRWARLPSDCCPGAANEVSEVGGDDDRALLVRYRDRTVVLGLQMRLVRWGVMTTGDCSPSPAPSHVRGMGAPPVCCHACTCICCIEGRADGGHQ